MLGLSQILVFMQVLLFVLNYRWFQNPPTFLKGYYPLTGTEPHCSEVFFSKVGGLKVHVTTSGQLLNHYIRNDTTTIVIVFENTLITLQNFAYCNQRVLLYTSFQKTIWKQIYIPSHKCVKLLHFMGRFINL